MARGRPQRIPNRLIPREVYKADEARCRARPAHGNDSDDTSVSNENEETDNEENRDRGAVTKFKLAEATTAKNSKKRRSRQLSAGR